MSEWLEQWSLNTKKVGSIGREFQPRERRRLRFNIMNFRMLYNSYVVKKDLFLHMWYKWHYKIRMDHQLCRTERDPCHIPWWTPSPIFVSASVHVYKLVKKSFVTVDIFKSSWKLRLLANGLDKFTFKTWANSGSQLHMYCNNYISTLMHVFLSSWDSYRRLVLYCPQGDISLSQSVFNGA